MKHMSYSKAAWGAGLLALALLSLLVTGIPHVGFSAHVLNQHLGLDPVPLFANPVYGWIVRLLAALTGGGAVFAINLFSALCGAALVVLVFRISYRSALGFNADRAMPMAAMHRVALGAAALTVLFLLASAPFTLAASRANPILFDLVLVAGAFYLVITFAVGTPFSRLALASLLYGVAVVEFTTAIILAPIFVVLVLARMWQGGVFTFRHVAIATGGLLAGLSLYFVQAGFFMASPAYHFRAFDGYFQVVWYILIEQYQSMTGGLPRVGWLTLLLVSFFPWVITLALRQTSSAGRKPGAMIGTLALYLVMAVLSVLLLLPDFPLAPANLTGIGRLFVTPYVFIALWVGHAAAFWMVTAFREKRFEKPGMKKARRVIGRFGLVAAPAFVVYTLVAHTMPLARDPAERLVYDFSREVVASAGDRAWLVTNTLLDDQIAIEAKLRGSPATLIRMSYARSVPHMKYIASLFKDDARLQSLARVGMTPLMDEWFFHLKDVERNTAVVHVPDLWMMAGYQAIPDRTVFNGAREDAMPSLDEVLARNQAFWSTYGRRLEAVEADKTRPQGVALEWIRTHISKIANNLGVLLEDMGRTDDAFSSYQQARWLAPDNLSALMNLHVLAQREKRPEFEALEAELIQRTEAVMGRVQTWSLSYVYGIVRVPELFANRGMAFAMSGKATMAISDMKRALALNQQNPQIQLALAGLYFGESRDIESREQYESVLEQDAGNVAALLGLMRLAVRNGQYAEAREHLAALRKTAIKPNVLRMDEAVLESLAGSPAMAMKLFRDVIKEEPENMQAWAALAITAAQMNDKAAGEEAMRKLRDAKMLAPGIQLVLAQSAVDQGDRDTARRHLSDILRRQPSNVPALEMTLRLDMYEGSRDQVQRTVEKVLAVDPRNALGNYMLGVHHYYNKEYALAESAYRASLATTRSPQALNDLAYVLYLQGNLDESEGLVRESIAINERNHSAWDTLGVILMQKNKTLEAEEALQKSLGLRPNTASVLLSLAVLYEKMGRTTEAGRIATDINARLNELSPQDQDRLRALLERLATAALTATP